MARRPLAEFDGVLEALGGLAGVAKVAGVGAGAVWNWKDRGRVFPARYYPAISDALAAKKKTVSLTLFSFRRKADGNNDNVAPPVVVPIAKRCKPKRKTKARS